MRQTHKLEIMNGSELSHAAFPDDLKVGVKRWSGADGGAMRRLSDLTTFHIGAGAWVLDAPDQGTLLHAIQDADDRHLPLLVLGGGSNVLINDAEDFPGLVLRDGRSQIDRQDGVDVPLSVRAGDSHNAAHTTGQVAGGDHVAVRASAGTRWDDLVQWSIDHELSGLEALSGIPGTVGAAPVQNVGAYGHEVSETVVSVHAWDRLARQEVVLTPAELDFSYRTSALKQSLPAAEPHHPQLWWGRTGRWVVLDVVFSLERSPLSAPVMYSQLAKHLDVRPGERVPSHHVRNAVLALRATKGMVHDRTDHDTWSAGSFFTNPIVPANFPLPDGAPAFPAGEGLVKTSAAWLIDHAGFSKGFGLAGPSGTAAVATLSTKHVLALTNRGQAHASDVVTLARAVRVGVEETFGITLVPEPVGVGLVI